MASSPPHHGSAHATAEPHIDTAHPDQATPTGESPETHSRLDSTPFAASAIPPASVSSPGSSSLSTSTTPSTKKSRPLVLFEKIRRLYNGDTKGIPVIGAVRIHEKEFQQLEELLAQSDELSYFTSCCLKASYNSRKRKLKYTMSGPIHAGVADKVRDAIMKHLGMIEQKYPTPNIAGQIESLSDRLIKPFFHMKAGHTPDGLWKFSGASDHRYCLVMEVAHAQKYEDAKKDVQHLIADTRGRPGLGIVININYNKERDIVDAAHSPTDLDRTAFISIFQLAQVKKLDFSYKPMVQEMLSEQVFRSKDGSTNNGHIELKIRDIIGLTHMDNVKGEESNSPVLDESVIIPHAILAEAVRAAENEIISDWNSHQSGGDMGSGSDGEPYGIVGNDNSSSDDSFPSTSSSEKDDKRKDPSYNNKARASSNPSSRGPSSRNAKKA
ncbi:hypothetical protein SLS56_010574 [Neofusicoccum ribis]|uniref:Uncharacterized protein n=1 Tax=Neofusicoccum ribis TaxID=45134 RepID=A0ABR3SEZ1_9PEZI